MVNCVVPGCCSSSRSQKLSWHRIPSDEKQASWLRACHRTDLLEKKLQQIRNYFVCSRHFEPWLYNRGKKKQMLKYGAIPTLNMPGMLEVETGLQVKTEDTDTFEDPLGEGTEDSLPTEGTEDSLTAEETEDVTVKQEVEDSFSEHVDDLLEKLENRKRRNDTNIAVSKPAKIVKILPNPEHNSLTVPYDRELEVFPVDFMKSVLNSQNEILSVLKSQVLLENPDSQLLTFLRLVGAKLSRLNTVKRKEVQNFIIDYLHNSGL